MKTAEIKRRRLFKIEGKASKDDAFCQVPAKSSMDGIELLCAKVLLPDE